MSAQEAFDLGAPGMIRTCDARFRKQAGISPKPQVSGLFDPEAAILPNFQPKMT